MNMDWIARPFSMIRGHFELFGHIHTEPQLGTTLWGEQMLRPSGRIRETKCRLLDLPVRRG